MDLLEAWQRDQGLVELEAAAQAVGIAGEELARLIADGAVAVVPLGRGRQAIPLAELERLALARFPTCAGCCG